MLAKQSTEAVHKALAKDASIVLSTYSGFWVRVNRKHSGNIHLFLKCADSPRLQLSSCALLGELLGSATDEVLKNIERQSGIKELCLSLCFQLRTKDLNIQLAEQVTTNAFGSLCNFWFLVGSQKPHIPYGEDSRRR